MRFIVALALALAACGSPAPTPPYDAPVSVPHPAARPSHAALGGIPGGGFIPPTRISTGGGGGDITSVIAGTCMLGGATSGDATLNVDPTCAQSRVTGTCGAGNGIGAINQDGTVTCNADPVYSHPTHTCTTGQHAFSVDSAGNWTCTVDATYTHPAKTCTTGQHLFSVDSAGNETCTADATYSHPTHTCGAGTHAFSVDASGNWTCTVDATYTHPTVTCAAGTHVGSVDSAGNGTCTADQNGLPDIDRDDGTSVGFFTSGANGVYIDSNSLNFGYSNAADSTSWIDYNGAANGILHYRTLIIGNGKEAAILTLNGPTKLAEFAGALTVDAALTVEGNVTLGTTSANTTETKGPLTVDGEPKCAAGAPTVSFGSVAGTNCGGTITTGTANTETITWTAGFWSHTPPCTFTMASGTSTAAIYITSQSTTSTAIVFPNALGTAQTVNYNCGWNY